MAQRMPRYWEAAKIEAERRGTTPEVVLQEDRKRLEDSQFPTPECLEADEVETLLANGEADRAAEHVETCAMCSSLVDAARSIAASNERITDTIRSKQQFEGEVAQAVLAMDRY